MIYLNNNTETQEVWIPRQEQDANTVSTCDKCYADGYADGVATCGHYQEKTVVVTADTMTILPDEGYAGMSEVEVDATSWGKDKYDDGYSSGTTNGEATQKAKLASTAFTQNGLYTREDGWNEVEVNVADLPCVIESKSYGLDSGFTGTTVYPDEGYDGIGSLTITDEGYGQKKFEDGQESVRSGMTDTTITANGYYPNSSGWSAVTVNVPQSGGGCTLQNKSLDLEYEDEGSWTVSPDSGYDGLSFVSVVDNGYGQKKYDEGYSDASCNLESGSFQLNTQDDTFYPSQGYDGFDTVYVDASGFGNNRHDEGWREGYSDGRSSILLEAASHTMTASTETVYPSSGYDGISEIAIDASSIVQDSHNVGYVEGYGDATVIKYTSSNGNIVVPTNPRAFRDTNNNVIAIKSNTYSNGVGIIVFNGILAKIGISDSEATDNRGDSKAFESCTTLTSISLPNTIEWVGYEAFNYCQSLRSFNLPDGAILKEGLMGNFRNSGIRLAVIPDSVTRLPLAEFCECPYLTTVILGRGLTEIRHDCFSIDPTYGNTASLQTIYSYATTAPTLNAGCFSGQLPNGVLYVPSGSASSYQSWLNYLPSGWTISATL